MESKALVSRGDLRIRDPYILPVVREGRYYLYGTTETPGSVPSAGFNAYCSEDLEHWKGPFKIFAPSNGFWADRDFWAPEVHAHNDRFYMFASFRSAGKRRATQILVADNPLGPFVPNGENARTPKAWDCLDGTLHVDDAGDPWMVFCHEWKQVGDGEICAVRLSPELDTTVGNPILLFTASQASWTAELPFCLPSSSGSFVTDGPFLHKTRKGDLLMLWSSFSKESNYSLGVARSCSGNLLGPWVHDGEPLYSNDGGHAMLFNAFDGSLVLALHAPNKNPRERALFLTVEERNGVLYV